MPGIPWLAQASALMSPQELGGLVRYLTPAIQNTGATIGETTKLINQADLLSRCFDHNIMPTGNEVIADPPIGTGQPVYRELFQSAVGLAGAAQNFDGNGRYIRANAGGGATRVHDALAAGGGPGLRQRGRARARHPSRVRAAARRRSSATSPATRTPSRDLNRVYDGSRAREARDPSSIGRTSSRSSRSSSRRSASPSTSSSTSRRSGSARATTR